MKNIIYIVLLFCLSVNAQVYRSFESFPLEKIYMHKNASLLFVGEYLYYKVYCLELETNKLSEVSKIAYVELINMNDKSVFKQKITLENGLGQGDFFIPTEINSGSYKLIAYTRWMQNNEKVHFFETQLNIINPYKGDQSNVVKNESISLKNNIKDNSQEFVSETKNTNLSRRYKLITSKETYEKREKITLQLLNTKEEYGFGKYSISVRKIDKNLRDENYTAFNFYSDNFNVNSKKTTNSKKIIPEYKGELISGRVLDINSKAINKKVEIAVSIPGDDLFFKIVETDALGEFNVFVDENYNGDMAVIQLIDKDRNNYQIKIDPQITINYSDITFKPFHITPKQKEQILKRSIHNQLENNYFAVKPDSIQLKTVNKYFYRNKEAKVFVLEDYKKFETLNDVFIEIVDPVYKNRDGGKINFKIKEIEDPFNKGIEPLVLFDGVLVQDYKALLDYSAKTIERIIVTNDKVVSGPETFMGVIAIESNNSNFNKGKYTEVLMDNPELQKKYFHQNYGDSLKVKYSRIPDYRDQLLWEPQIVLNSNKKEFYFYTSDISGTFEIVLEGFSAIGEAVSLRKTIEVN